MWSFASPMRFPNRVLRPGRLLSHTDCSLGDPHFIPEPELTLAYCKHGAAQ